MQRRIALEVTQHLPMTRSMSLTAHCVQSFPFALLRSPNFGDIQWGYKNEKESRLKIKTMQIVNVLEADS